MGESAVIFERMFLYTVFSFWELIVLAPTICDMKKKAEVALNTEEKFLMDVLIPTWIFDIVFLDSR